MYQCYVGYMHLTTLHSNVFSHDVTSLNSSHYCSRPVLSGYLVTRVASLGVSIGADSHKKRRRVTNILN